MFLLTSRSALPGLFPKVSASRSLLCLQPHPEQSRDTRERPSAHKEFTSLAVLSKKTPRGRKVRCWGGGQAPQRVNGAAAQRGTFACHYIMQTYIPALTEQVQNMPFAGVGFPPPPPRSLTARSRERSLWTRGSPILTPLFVGNAFRWVKFKSLNREV